MPGAVAALIGSFGARLGMDETDYVRGIINAQSASRIFGETFASFIANPLLGSLQLLKSFSVAAFHYGQDVINLARDTKIFADSTNASVEFIQALKAQFEGAGRSAEEAQPTLLKVVEALDQARRAGGPAADALREMGVSLAGVTSTDEALRRIIDGLAGVEDPARRAALAMELLGDRSGPDLVAIIGATNGAVDQMIQRARDLGLVMDTQTVHSISGLENALTNAQQALEGIKQTAAANFLAGLAGADPAHLSEGLQKLASTLERDLAPAMRTTGEATRSFIDLLIELKPLWQPFVDYLGAGAGFVQLGLSGLSGRNPAGVLSGAAQFQRRFQGGPIGDVNIGAFHAAGDAYVTSRQVLGVGGP